MQKKIIRITRDVLFVLAVIVLTVSAVCLVLQIKPAVVVSGSMEPAIKTGSLIFISQRDKEAVPGDIIAFDAGKASVAHRVKAVTENGYITKGDNNDTEDAGTVAYGAVQGKVKFWIPGVGYAVKWIGNIPEMLAYLTSSDDKINTFTVGNSKVEINEEFIPDDLEPGAVIRKKVNIANDGRTPCAVRVMMSLSNDDMKSWLETDINTEMWELKDDGYYYYKEILDKGAITDVLFTELRIREEAPEKAMSDLDIYIYAECRNADMAQENPDVKW